MILHSVAPLSMLLPEQEQPPLETLPAGGALLEGRRTPEGFLVSRLISTNPADYLSARYMPGSLCPLAAAEEALNGPDAPPTVLGPF
ncbi:MAG: hypothetical protein HFG27_03710 [Provencibacterium sp.]|jgi:hypothetical protein|nr:hypothetical protein [Provencibacterium sp.]